MTAARAVEAYLAAVRDGLADLPAAERTELLHDLEAHLADVVAEFEADREPVTDVALTHRLGRPEDYAADLRESAGYTGGDKLLGRLRRRNDRRRELRPRLALWCFLLSCALAAFAGYLAVDVLDGGQSLLMALAAVTVPAAIAAALVRSIGIAALAELPEVRRAQGWVEGLRPRTMPGCWPAVRPHLRPTWYVVRGWAAAVAVGVALNLDSAMLPFPSLSIAGLGRAPG